MVVSVALQPSLVREQQTPHNEFVKKSFSALFQDSAIPSPISIKTLSMHKGQPAFILFSKDISQLVLPFKFALVGKFSHGRPTLEIIRKILLAMDLKSSFTVKLLDPRHVLITFTNEGDFHRVWCRSIWYVYGFPMRVFKWSPKFHVDKESSFVPLWFSLPKLPIHLFDKAMIFSFVSVLGKPLFLDKATASLLRPSVARVCVEVDLLKPLTDRIWIGDEDGDGFWQSLQPENLPKYCDHCFHQGHNQEECRVKNLSLAIDKEKKNVIPMVPKDIQHQSEFSTPADDQMLKSSQVLNGDKGNSHLHEVESGKNTQPCDLAHQGSLIKQGGELSCLVQNNTSKSDGDNIILVENSPLESSHHLVEARSNAQTISTTMALKDGGLMADQSHPLGAEEKLKETSTHNSVEVNSHLFEVEKSLKVVQDCALEILNLDNDVGVIHFQVSNDNFSAALDVMEAEVSNVHNQHSKGTMDDLEVSSPLPPFDAPNDYIQHSQSNKDSLAIDDNFGKSNGAVNSFEKSQVHDKLEGKLIPPLTHAVEKLTNEEIEMLAHQGIISAVNKNFVKLDLMDLNDDGLVPSNSLESLNVEIPHHTFHDSHEVDDVFDSLNESWALLEQAKLANQGNLSPCKGHEVEDVCDFFNGSWALLEQAKLINQGNLSPRKGHYLMDMSNIPRQGPSTSRPWKQLRSSIKARRH